MKNRPVEVAFEGLLTIKLSGRSIMCNIGTATFPRQWPITVSIILTYIHLNINRLLVKLKLIAKISQRPRFGFMTTRRFSHGASPTPLSPAALVCGVGWVERGKRVPPFRCQANTFPCLRPSYAASCCSATNPKNIEFFGATRSTRMPAIPSELIKPSTLRPNCIGFSGNSPFCSWKGVTRTNSS